MRLVERLKHALVNMESVARIPRTLDALGQKLEAQNIQAMALREAGQAAARGAAESQFVALSSKISAVSAQVGAVANDANAALNKAAETADRLARLEASLEAASRSTALLGAGHVARLIQKGRTEAGPQRRAEAKAEPLEASLAKLKALSPAIFPYWQQLFNNATTFYDDDVEASASVWGHKYAQLFGAYVSLFDGGRVLDVGCGINGKPSYLGAVPNSMLSGLEPLAQKSDPGFDCVQGFNEFLPWENGSFETVISGTSLDHVLSIEKSLEEVVRVLVPGGRYLVWLASIPGSPAYKPEDPDFKPRDQFHLFHFDRVWIEPVFAKSFEFQDVTIIPQPGFDHVFYCLTTKRL